MGRVADALNRARTGAVDRSEHDSGLIQFFTPSVPPAPPPWTIGASDARPVPLDPVRPSRPSFPFGSPHSPGSDLSGKLLGVAGVKPEVREEYNRLATTLHQVQLEQGARVITLTASARGEGTTLTSANLVLMLSESHGRRVLLVDADLRQPTMHHVFGVPQAPGLSDLLLGGGQLPVVPIGRCLSLLTSGQTDRDPMTTLTCDRMRSLIEEARRRFDWVIIDTPPVGLLPDAKLVASMADVRLLVVSSGRTAYESVQRAVEALGPSAVAGIVLNRGGRDRP